MPYVFRPKIRRILRTVIAAMCLTAVLAPSAAQAACVEQPSSQVFSVFGDLAWYSLAPGGSFESGTAAWTHSGTKVVTGNETYYLNARTDTRSLQVPASKSAMSPSFCVG